MILGALVWGGLHSVKFREDQIYSYRSFSLPGNPYLHQMIIHRSMMALFSFVTAIFALNSLPYELSTAILFLFPLLMFILCFIFGAERIGKAQLIALILGYSAVLLLSNPGLL